MEQDQVTAKSEDKPISDMTKAELEQFIIKTIVKDIRDNGQIRASLKQYLL